MYNRTYITNIQARVARSEAERGRAVAERGRLDIVVNNTGGAMPASWLASAADHHDGP
jgi:hypothetical protein